MAKLISTFLAACLLVIAIPRLVLAQSASEMNLIPWPKTLRSKGGLLNLTAASRIIVADKTLLPLGKVLSSEIELAFGKRLAVVQGKAQPGDIAIEILSSLKPEAYELNVTNTATIQGADYVGAAHGTVTLLQLIASDKHAISVPLVSISDEPAIGFRSVMLDLARRWQPVDTIKDTVELLRLYKIRYLHLHLSDNESFTYSSKAFPALADKDRSYTSDQMNELVRYADERGVTLIPEIDMPGHSGPMVSRLPKLLGRIDPSTGKAVSTGVVNMASETAYETLDTLIGELTETFKSSPYIHIGADETSADGLKKLPEYLPYVQSHGLKEAEAGKSSELFAHFIARMGDSIKKRGRTMIVWNGFPVDGTGDVTMPKDDMVVMSWTGSPLDLVARGYKIVNCCWLPLYMVPTQGRAPEPQWIYDWNVHQSGSWGEAMPVEIPDTAQVLGAQICFWEQRYNDVMPILRPRVPAMAERLWNPDAGKTFQDFGTRENHTNQIVERLLRPVTIAVKGLIDPGGVTFDKQLEITLKSSSPGKICFTVSKPWEKFPTSKSPVYSSPMVINDTATVSAQLFDEAGQPIGGVTQERFSKITPGYKYRLMGPAPQPIWSKLPDFSTLTVLQSGVQGLMTTDRGEEVNRGMFAGIPVVGQIDTRLPGVWNPRALELTGQVKIPVNGTYTFKMKATDGQAELELGSRVICKTRHSGTDAIAQGALPEGTYPFVIRYYNRQITNDLNLQFTGPGEKKFVPFEKLVLPISMWKKGTALSSLSADVVFVDPAKAGTMNLATDKPVTVSGGTQGDMIPSNAVDGDTSNESSWHSGGTPAWLEVDLQRPHMIDRVKVYTYFGDGRYYQYIVEASADNKEWKQVVDMSSNTNPSTEAGDDHHFSAMKARYVRITLLKNSANRAVHLNELMVFEAK